MTALNKLTIPELIARLNSLGVEWVGSTTRKAPLIETINRFAYNADYLHNDKEAEITAKGLLKGLNYPVCNLVGMLRYWGQTVTSDEMADPHTLQQRVLEIARQKYPPELTSLSISELIGRLDTLGVKWVGNINPKQPLVELVAKLESLPEVRSESDLPSTMRFVSAPVDSYSWEQLVLIWRHFNRGPLMSYEVLDRDIMWAKVKALLCSLPGRTLLPSLDKVLSYSWEDLKDLPIESLRVVTQRTGLPPYLQCYDLDQEKRNMIHDLKPTLAGMRRRSERNLVFDPAGCQYVYESKAGFQFKIAEDMWETPTKPLYHALVLQDLRSRGFYEPDCVTDALHGLYLVCDLADAPKVYLKPGDRVTLKPETKSLTSFTRDYDWFSPGDIGTIEAASPTE